MRETSQGQFNWRRYFKIFYFLKYKGSQTLKISFVLDIDVTNLFTMKPTKLLLKMCITKHWNDVTDAYDRDVKIEARFVFSINMIGSSAKTSYFQKNAESINW